MRPVSLYKKSTAACPEEIDGCPIRPGFKNILRILKMTASPKYSGVMKYSKALEYFYAGEQPVGAFEKMMEFINMGQEDERSGETDGEPQIDFDFDANEIFCSFMAEYGINLLREDMHWYEFYALLNGLPSECALNRKIQLRFADLKGYRGKALEEMLAAKRRVQIPDRMMTPEEAAAEKAFEEKWGRL